MWLYSLSFQEAEKQKKKVNSIQNVQLIIRKMLIQERLKKAAGIPQEPAPNSLCYQIAIRLPSGTKVTRR